MATRQAVYRYVVLEENLESVGVRMVVELGLVETIGDQKDDLASTGSAIMKQLGGRMDGVVKCFGWAGTKVIRCRLGRFDHPDGMDIGGGSDRDVVGMRGVDMNFGVPLYVHNLD